MTASLLSSCSDTSSNWQCEVFETSASGNKMQLLQNFKMVDQKAEITIDPTKSFQTITGIGGSFTESSAFLLNQLSKKNRQSIIEAYFGESGAQYSLTRTHINSCDFSLSNYAYVTDPQDKDLTSFDISHDKEAIIPMIQDAMKASKEGFKIIASPWTAPPFMKDNNSWVGGTLKPEYRSTWALYFSKYIKAMREEGVNIWGVTVENEPLGNGNNWESMHFTAEEMTAFIQDYLGPSLEKEGLADIVLLGYDQNRDHLKEWVDVMYQDENTSRYIDGTAIHWYASTYEVFPDVLQYAHQKAPNKYLIETEGCIDAEIPQWKDDAWYWKKEATDWGWDWAPEEDKHLHPKYAPVYRYARDIIGCFNNHVDGWIDWNMVLDKQGGPNWFKNWCLAPIIVDPEKDEVYITPLYYALAHFSKFMRPGAKRIETTTNQEKLHVTAVINPDGKIAVAVLNENEVPISMNIQVGAFQKEITIKAQAIQTILLYNSDDSIIKPQ